VQTRSFVYTTYIRTTPERLWKALTEPAFTDRYWSISFETDWEAGSPMSWKQRGLTIADPEQVVLESVPFRRLSYTWHTITPEWLDSFGFTDEAGARLAGERRSKVTFEIERLDAEQVKLTVLHDDLEPDGITGMMVSQGWPRVFANLKTLLETGETLPDNPEPPAPIKLGLTGR
jgi:uncharacterized protein YndB with AHSA1/START domain